MILLGTAKAQQPTNNQQPLVHQQTPVATYEEPNHNLGLVFVDN